MMSTQVLLPFCVILSLVTLMICRRRVGLRAAVNMGLLLVGASCVTALINPWAGHSAMLGLVIFTTLCGVCIALVPRWVLLGLSTLIKNLPPRVLDLGLLACTVVFILGCAEILALSFFSSDVATRAQPLITVLVDGTEDYRGYHMVGDPYHVPDPDLAWVPCSGPPFNEQKMRGPLLEVPKPKDVLRILCYGDSNTEGSCDYRSWPEELHVALQNVRSSDGRRYEVANAGVAGYSSHQGLKRFLKDVDRYHPDIVFVSFGWNDFAKTAKPDNAYQPPPRVLVATKRFLLEYQFFLVLLDTLSAPVDKVALAEEGNTPKLPRVSVEDYLENLQGFADATQSRGIRLVLLTRPHQNQDAYSGHLKEWIKSAEQYNAAGLGFASLQGIEHIDIESFFAQRQQELCDACHFSSNGNRIMAKLLRDHLADEDPKVALVDER